MWFLPTQFGSMRWHVPHNERCTCGLNNLLRSLYTSWLYPWLTWLLNDLNRSEVSLSRKPNLRANIEIYSFLALEELFQFLGIKRCLIAIYCFSRFGILNISGQMSYGADGSLTSEWFACLKTEHDYGKVFKLINFGITAYTRVILMMMLQSQHFRLLDSTFHNITHKA